MNSEADVRGTGLLYRSSRRLVGYFCSQSIYTHWLSQPCAENVSVQLAPGDFLHVVSGEQASIGLSRSHKVLGLCPSMPSNLLFCAIVSLLRIMMVLDIPWIIPSNEKNGWISTNRAKVWPKLHWLFSILFSPHCPCGGLANFCAHTNPNETTVNTIWYAKITSVVENIKNRKNPFNWRYLVLLVMTGRTFSLRKGRQQRLMSLGICVRTCKMVTQYRYVRTRVRTTTGTSYSSRPLGVRLFADIKKYMTLPMRNTANIEISHIRSRAKNRLRPKYFLRVTMAAKCELLERQHR